MKPILCGVFCACAAFGQMAFEVASIKPSAPPTEVHVKVGIHQDGARITYTYMSLKDCIDTAYDVKEYQILGPDWLASARFDISATLPAGAKPENIPDMLKTLLAERFGLKVHHDSKEFPVYAIIRGKGPLKLKQTPPDENADRAAVNITADGGRNGVNIGYGGGSWFSFANNRLEGKKLSMSRLARTLARFEDRPVVDMSELPGDYDFVLEFSQEDYQAMLMRAALSAGVSLPPQAIQMMEAASGDSLLTAMEGLGLKLDRRKAPLDVWVVDHCEHMPTEN
jgi:uncharacterized protein (TIGR03435 family)